MPHSVQLGNFKHTCYRLLPTGWVIQNLLTATSRGMKPLLICIEDAWKVSGRCLDQSFWTKVCKYVSFQTKLFSDHKENPKENSSVALLSLTCFISCFNWTLRSKIIRKSKKSKNQRKSKSLILLII